MPSQKEIIDDMGTVISKLKVHCSKLQEELNEKIKNLPTENQKTIENELTILINKLSGPHNAQEIQNAIEAFDTNCTKALEKDSYAKGKAIVEIILGILLGIFVICCCTLLGAVVGGLGGAFGGSTLLVPGTFEIGMVMGGIVGAIVAFGFSTNEVLKKIPRYSSQYTSMQDDLSFFRSTAKELKSGSNETISDNSVNAGEEEIPPMKNST